MTRPSVRSLLQVSVLVNVLAAGYVLLMFLQRVPPTLRPRQGSPQTGYSAATATHKLPPTCPRCAECPAPASAAAASSAHTSQTSIARYALCDHALTPAAVRGLRLRPGSDDLLAVHCGDSVDLLGFDPAGPRRVAHIDKRTSDPKLHWQTAPIVAADIDADGLGDLLIGFAATDATGGPHGGALIELVSTSDGGFAAPRLLAPLNVMGLDAGHLDAVAGADIVVLHHDDTRLGRNNALIALHGGPSPVKMLATQAPTDARSVTALDLDLDGRDELVITSLGAAPEVLYLGTQGEVVRRATLPVPASMALLAADLDGDGAKDAVFSGAKLYVVLASRDHPEQVQVLADEIATPKVVALDLDGDGKVDLAGVRDNTVFAYIQSAPLRFATTKLAVLPASEFALDDLVALSATKPRLVVVRRDTTHAELAVVPLDIGVQALKWDSQSTPLVDSPWSLRITVL